MKIKLFTEIKQLKTLKDISSNGVWLMNTNELKDAAREWVKEILKNFKKYHSRKKYNLLLKAIKSKDITYDVWLSDKYLYVGDEDIIDVVSKVQWIKYFFNLEE